MDAIKKVLTDILKDMDIPAMRRELNVHNLKWLARNLHFKNKDKDSFPSAIHFITTLLWMQGEQSVTIE
jgi:hypothetical protein